MIVVIFFRVCVCVSNLCRRLVIFLSFSFVSHWTDSKIWVLLSLNNSIDNNMDDETEYFFFFFFFLLFTKIRFKMYCCEPLKWFTLSSLSLTSFGSDETIYSIVFHIWNRFKKTKWPKNPYRNRKRNCFEYYVKSKDTHSNWLLTGCVSELVSE